MGGEVGVSNPFIKPRYTTDKGAKGKRIEVMAVIRIGRKKSEMKEKQVSGG